MGTETRVTVHSDPGQDKTIVIGPYGSNLPYVNVEIDEDDMGTASPRGTLAGIKQNIPFTLNYAAKAEYPFGGWQASLKETGELIASWTPNGAEHSERVSWNPVNPSGTEAQAVIHYNPGADKTIVIGPYGFRWPYLKVEVEEKEMGTAIPRGTLTGIKQNIPFTLNYTANAAYPFIGWEAAVDGVMIASWTKEGSQALNEWEPGKVSWKPVNISGTETQVTIHLDPGAGKTLVIGPYGATQPMASVAVDEQGMGIAVPRGTLSGIRMNIPFTLSYSSFSEYGFLRWEAVNASGTVLGTNEVEFSAPTATETTVTVKTSDSVTIRPVGGLAPAVSSISPSPDERRVATDRTIRIRFSKPLDPNSFLFDSNKRSYQGDWRYAYFYPKGDEEYGYDNRVYKNILIEGPNISHIDEMKGNNWAPFYYPPELSDDGTILSLVFRTYTSNADVSGYNLLTITLNRDIKDTQGISMGTTYTFNIETQGRTNARKSPTDDDPPYPKVLGDANVVVVKALPPDAGHPDGQIDPDAKFFGWEENAVYGPEGPGPSPEASHHFEFEKDDNRIYIAFQTELMDYPFTGALVYEAYFDTSANQKYNYTGEIAAPVYDPAIVGPITEYFRKTYSHGHNHPYTPSRPIRVVRYNLARQTIPNPVKDQPVSLCIIPIDTLDNPNIGTASVKTNVSNLCEADLFSGGTNAQMGFSSNAERAASQARISIYFLPPESPRRMSPAQ
jgi:hypothetical protein